MIVRKLALMRRGIEVLKARASNISQCFSPGDKTAQAKETSPSSQWTWLWLKQITIVIIASVQSSRENAKSNCKFSAKSFIKVRKNSNSATFISCTTYHQSPHCTVPPSHLLTVKQHSVWRSAFF